MIWHDRMHRNFSISKMARDGEQAFLNDFAQIVQLHFRANDFSEDAPLLPRTNGHEVTRRLRIVELLKANRASARKS
jgi:hypothetical protein